ncbi:ribonuclease H [Senna tora]|uniref:Ribonuclease H n=1 Tax=Senna tora TaxID=362788 RepID=A0A834U049_9FABA|nr:ribonuclease H [Senna tora]
MEISPNDDWTKVNIDGSCKGDNLIAACVVFVVMLRGLGCGVWPGILVVVILWKLSFGASCQRIRRCCSRDWCIRLKHVYREANMVAYWMAGFAHSCSVGSHFFVNPIDGCKDLLNRDLVGVALPRLVSCR